MVRHRPQTLLDSASDYLSDAARRPSPGHVSPNATSGQFSRSSIMAKSRNPGANKAAKAEAKAARKAASKQRRSQLWQAFQIQRKEDKRLLPYMIGAFVLIVAASVVF